VRVAGSTLVAVGQPPAESLPVLRELGFDRVELAFYEGWTAVGPRGVEESQLRMTLRQLALEAVALNVGVGGLSRPAARSAVTDCLRLAHALEIGVVTVQAEPVLDLPALVRSAGRAGITLAVETHLGYVTESATGAIRLLAEVPGLGLTLDPSHYAFLGQESDLAGLVGRAAHVHYRDAARGTLQLAPGEGAIDPASFVRCLVDGGFAGTVTVEYVDAPDDALAARRLLEAA